MTYDTWKAREPMEEACDCGDFYRPCACDIENRIWQEHSELRDALEALESAAGKWMPSDSAVLVMARRLLARVYREGQ